jgi:ferritin-like metal-binding protein YciE
MNDAIQTVARDTLIVGMRNAHSMEQQAISVLNAQLGRLSDYPDLRSRVERHIEESRVQAERLQRMLDRFETSPSTFKDTMMSLMGSAQSSMQAMAEDAVLKASFANFMFEHFEIAAYKSMIALAEQAGMHDVKSELEISLREEQEMARWLDERIADVTRRYVELTARDGGGLASSSLNEGSSGMADPSMGDDADAGGRSSGMSTGASSGGVGRTAAAAAGAMGAGASMLGGDDQRHDVTMSGPEDMTGVSGEPGSGGSGNMAGRSRFGDVTMSGPEDMTSGADESGIGIGAATGGAQMGGAGAAGASGAYGDVDRGTDLADYGSSPAGSGGRTTADRMEDQAGVAADYGSEGVGEFEDPTRAQARPGEWPNEPRNTVSDRDRG